jgi:ketosteroid isomerase-like protein
VHEELLKVVKDFGQAVIKNDADAVARFLHDHWIIIDPDGGIVDKERFLAVIRSGALTHEAMKSEDVRVRMYGDTAVVTALTATTGAYNGQRFTTLERATDVLVKTAGEWQTVSSQLTRFKKN